MVEFRSKPDSPCPTLEFVAWTFSKVQKTYNRAFPKLDQVSFSSSTLFLQHPLHPSPVALPTSKVPFPTEGLFSPGTPILKVPQFYSVGDSFRRHPHLETPSSDAGLLPPRRFSSPSPSRQKRPFSRIPTPRHATPHHNTDLKGFM